MSSWSGPPVASCWCHPQHLTSMPFRRHCYTVGVCAVRIDSRSKNAPLGWPCGMPCSWSCRNITRNTRCGHFLTKCWRQMFGPPHPSQLRLLLAAQHFHQFHKGCLKKKKEKGINVSARTGGQLCRGGKELGIKWVMEFSLTRHGKYLESWETENGILLLLQRPFFCPF